MKQKKVASRKLVANAGAMSRCLAALFLACCGTCCCMRLPPIVPLSRRSCLLSAAGVAAIPLAGASAADSAQTLALLKEARAQLDACDGLIADGSWDMVRTVVKTPPLVNAKNLITTYIKVRCDSLACLLTLTTHCTSRPQARRQRTWSSRDRSWCSHCSCWT